MATYNEQMQKLFKQYEDEGNPTPATLATVAAWAVHKGLWKSKPADMIKQCTEDLGQALRVEYRTDNKGRRYRAKLCAKDQMEWRWADIDTAPRDHVERALAHRRKQVVSDLHQLKVDMDHYNDAHPDEEPIQMIFDFTEDIEEREATENQLAS